MKVLTRLTLYIYLLLLVGCGGGSSENDRPESMTEQNVNGTPSLDQVYAYKTTSKSKQILYCSKLYLSSDSCDIANIKPIGADMTRDISLEDVKNRLVVSHAWMGDSFIAALEVINDQDLLNLFKPINAIVLSYEIRPSHYRATTASIYIDPRYLWRDSEEWETIYKQDDYRDSFNTGFTFKYLRRYLNASTNQYINWSNQYHAESYSSRTSAQIAPGLFRLLSHELAHANDFLPPELIATLTNSGKIWNDYIRHAAEINDELHDTIPLTSDLAYEAAQISFRGTPMTDRIRTTTASEMGSAFHNDGAADFYSYSTGAEDLAMLFEAFMMHKKYGAVSDIAFTTSPTTEDYDCDDHIIKWGQKNRLADSNVKQRAILIGDRILGKDITTDLSLLSPAPTNTMTDIGWCSARLKSTAALGDALRKGQQVVYDYRDDIVRGH